ncbi:MAG: PD-(D/E)XK nuclease family protein [Elusimicrobiota bacterium]
MGGQEGLWHRPARGADDGRQEHIESDTSRKFSPSKLNLYRECPRRYRYRYVDHMRRDVKTVEAYLGTCVHGALERLYADLAHGKKPDCEEVLGGFDAAWSAGWSADVAIKHAEYSAQHYQSLGRDCVRTYYQAYAPFGQDQTVAVEKRLGFPLASEGEEYLIEGLVDRLALAPDGAFEVHDYKTTGSLPAQAHLDADWQLAIYDLAVRHNWPDTRDVRLVWHFLRFGKTLTSRRSPEALAALRGELAALIAAIKHDHDFFPRKSALCDWCEYRGICPLWAHAEQVKSMSAAALHRDDGVRLVDGYGALEAKKKDLREKLREIEAEQKALEDKLAAFAASRGFFSVAGSDGEVSISEREEYRFPTRTHAPEAWESIEAELKAEPLWAQVSHLDAHLLMEGYKRKEWDAAGMAAIEALLSRHARHIELVKKRTLRFHRKKEAQAD